MWSFLSLRFTLWCLFSRHVNQVLWSQVIFQGKSTYKLLLDNLFNLLLKEYDNELSLLKEHYTRIVFIDINNLIM